MAPGGKSLCGNLCNYLRTHRNVGHGGIVQRTQIRRVDSKRAILQYVEAIAAVWALCVVADLDLDETLDRIACEVSALLACIRHRQRAGKPGQGDDEERNHHPKIRRNAYPMDAEKNNVS